MHTIWSADWQESQRVPETLLAEWLESGDVQVRLKPNARGKIKPAYVATVRFHKVRDLSCQMGPRVIEAAMMGSAHHRAVVAAWA